MELRYDRVASFQLGPPFMSASIWWGLISGHGVGHLFSEADHDFHNTNCQWKQPIQVEFNH